MRGYTIYYSPHNNVSFTTESLPLHRQPNFWDFASFSLRTILPESAVTQIEPNSLSTKALASAETIIGSGFLVVVFAALNAYLTPRFEKIGKPSGFLQTLTQDGSAIRVLVKESPLIVSKSGQGYYKTISEAIRNAEDGWCINVQPGYYTEDLIIDKRGLEIKGIRNKVIVQAVDGPCLRMATDKAKIYGLNLNGPVMNTGRQYPAVDVSQGELELDNCDITSRSFACVAVYAAKPNAKLWLKNCRIHDGTYVGILIDSNGQGVMEYCEIYENGQAGVHVARDGKLTVDRCNFYNNKSDGLQIDDGGEVALKGCNINANAQSGFLVGEGGRSELDNCNIRDNRKAAIKIKPNGYVKMRDCDIKHEGRVAVDFDLYAEGVVENNTFKVRRGILGRKDGEFVSSRTPRLVRESGNTKKA